ncbi:MAG TPA: GDSL-type esterase/lipase family protein [Acidimicrobiales bacterium]|nr:GDSL-type esterase/lipase family protein [Acidimicrobiales bacterium]
MRPARRHALAVIGAAVLLGAAALGTWSIMENGPTRVGGHVATSVAAGRNRVQPGPPNSSTVRSPPRWEVGWGSAMAWGYQTVTDATVRTLVDIPVDSLALRVRISNQFGKAPLTVGAASVGRSTAGAAVDAHSLHRLRFAGQDSTVVPAGGWALSDPVALPSNAPQMLAVSVFVTGSNLISSHYPCCEASTPSFLSTPGSGNLTGAASAAGFGYRAPWSRLVDAVDVQRPAPPAGHATEPGSIVVLGDSITDGFNSAARWTDLLQARIQALPVFERPPVVNEAITANTLTAVTPNYSASGGGPPGVDRLTYDALSFPGVATVVVFLGTNDLYFGASAASVVDGLSQAAAAAHASGARVVAVTLTPRMGSEGWSPARQAELDQVNHWMGETQAFDGVINFYAALADVYNGSCQPASMFPALDSGDHLHPNATGAAVMADAIDPAVLGVPPLPAVPVSVNLTPVPGCA